MTSTEKNSFERKKQTEKGMQRGAVHSPAINGDVDSGIFSVGVITNLEDGFACSFLEAVQEVCLAHDVLVNLAICHNSLEQVAVVDKFVAKGIRNIIILGHDLNLDFNIFENARSQGVNIVFFDRVIPGSFADYVGLDNHDAITSIMNDAARRGIESLIYADISDQDVDSTRERRNAFIEECVKRGIKHSIFAVPKLSVDRYEPFKICRDFLARQGRLNGSGLICANDRIAMSIVNACPRYLRVYSIDGSPGAVQSGIISYRQPTGEMALTALEALQRQLLNGYRCQAEKIRVKGELMRI